MMAKVEIKDTSGLWLSYDKPRKFRLRKRFLLWPVLETLESSYDGTVKWVRVDNFSISLQEIVESSRPPSNK